MANPRYWTLLGETLLLPLFLFLILSFRPSSALARPEYATRQKANCTACHVTPWGGGPRLVFGKVYGSHGYPPAKTSASDLYYADVRFIDYYPTQKTTQRVNGLALMEAAVTGNVPIIQDENDHSELRGVLTYNLAPLSGAQLREAYLRWALSNQLSETPTYLIFGRFYVPFGLLTDEHRTYTRLQTNSMINNYEVGGAVSTNFNESVHADFALVNDFQTQGNFNNGDLTYGTVLNVRWNPKQLPFLLGVSGIYERTLNFPQPLASSLYAVLSLDRLTKDKVSASLNFERVDAKNWNNPAINNGGINPGLQPFFGTNTIPGYAASINTAHSAGYYAWARYNMSKRWNLIYKFDYLDLDIASSSNDRYLRNGFGFETYLMSNLTLNARYELAHVMQGAIADSNVLAAQSDVFAMLRVWL